MVMSLIHELTERGFIHQTSADLADILDGTKRTIYLGVDPTADSIHAGNFLIYMLLKHLAQAGHTIILLAGGGTGRIGDPKPDAERVLIDYEEVNRRVEKLQNQAATLLSIPDLKIVDNYEWLGKLNVIDFLRDIGKHFTVGELIKKEAIAKRLQSDVGLSYTEFAYPLLQGYDFLELHRQHGCDVQVGGSDQWGNIVAGVDLVRRKEQKKVFALTVPLVTDRATGKKFGKSEGNAVWLDPEKTSPYDFYQFWLNASDESVVDYLKLFTFLPLQSIKEIKVQHTENPGARLAQKTLALEVTKTVHGEEVASAVEEVSEVLFGGSIETLSKAGVDVLVQSAPVHKIADTDTILQILVQSELASSNREAREFLSSGAVSVNGEKIQEEGMVVTLTDYPNNIALLRRGKKKMCVLIF